MRAAQWQADDLGQQFEAKFTAEKNRPNGVALAGSVVTRAKRAHAEDHGGEGPMTGHPRAPAVWQSTPSILARFIGIPDGSS